MPKATVALDSEGGNGRAALTIGDLIRYYKFETRAYLECTSACPIIWLAGVIRHMHHMATLGVHSAHERGRRIDKANQYIGAYMARMGAPQEMIDLQRKTEPWQMHHIKYHQVKAWGLLNPRQFEERR